MRRNAENLLVLTGAEPGRRFSGAYPLLDVVRAAAAEIADYTRIDIALLPHISVAERAVGDLVHLLAELLENAATYSPPHTRVTVSGRRTVSGAVISVYDNGIGLTPQALSVANQRLRGPTMLTSTVAGTLGLLVVARLAAHHDVDVELRSRDGRGTAALIGLPNKMIADHIDPHTTPTVVERRGERVPESGPVPHVGLGQIAEPARKALAMVHATPIIYDQLISAWFAGGSRSTGHASTAAAFANAPGDRERALVERLAAQPPSHVDGSSLPRRPRGAHLMPGSVPEHEQDRRRGPIDPDQVRSQLTGLTRGMAAAARIPTHNHIGQPT
jgi:hypothetical protein